MVSRYFRPVLLLIIVTVMLSAQESVPSTAGETITATNETEPVKTDSSHSQQQAERKQKRQKVTVGFYVLWGIVFLGIVTILITMMMGRTLRRMVRSPMPKTSNRDDLWYLKPEKKPESSDSDDSTSTET